MKGVVQVLRKTSAQGSVFFLLSLKAGGPPEAEKKVLWWTADMAFLVILTTISLSAVEYCRQTGSSDKITLTCIPFTGE